MRQTMGAFLLLAATVISPPSVFAAGVDSAAALGQAKRYIAEKNFYAATTALASAMTGIEQLPAADRTPALTALHFYSAVAHSGLRDDAKARTHLTEYLRLAPNGRRIDASKYDSRFVTLFLELASAGSAVEDQSIFATLYPGYSAVRASGAASLPDTSDRGVALILLGTAAEKKTWDTLLSATERQRFMTTFWKRRDASPGSESNEFRLEFDRRVAFADQVFAAADSLGSMTDRGKVFVLLGEPAFVRRRPINNSDGVRLVGEAINIVNGTIEHWVYSKEQLPAGSLTKPTVLFRFVTQQGIGNAVLQQDKAIGRHVLSLARGVTDRD